MNIKEAVPRSILILAFGTFVVLGLPDGMLGVAWPSMSAEFLVPLGSLGILLASFATGYTGSSLVLGVIIARVGYPTVLVGSLGALATAGLVYYVGSTWWIIIGASVIMGIGAGLLDGGMNAYGAHRFRPRDLNWLHAAYGVGATLGPMVMTPLVVAGDRWQNGYAVFAVLAAIAFVLVIARRREWHIPPPAEKPTPQELESEENQRRRRRLIIAVSVLVFFVYTGLEVVAGQWAFSLLSISRGIPVQYAGTAVALYYGALTVGRILFGVLSERIDTTRLLRTVLLGVTTGTILIWIPRPLILAPIGLVLTGFSLAPIFPMLMAQTPGRVGNRLASHAVGFQIAAANVGAIGCMAVTGVGVEVFSLEIVGPFVAVSAIVLVGLHETLLFIAPDPAAG